MQDFRRLIVWQKAHKLALTIRQISDRFPRQRYSSFRSQITRSAESIPFNIVEGTAAQTQREFARFLEIGLKSATELEYQLLMARDFALIHNSEFQTLTEEAVRIRKMLYRLRVTVLESDRQKSSVNGADPETKNPKLETKSQQ